jgi:hypothetical protein
MEQDSVSKDWPKDRFAKDHFDNILVGMRFPRQRSKWFGAILTGVSMLTALVATALFPALNDRDSEDH